MAFSFKRRCKRGYIPGSNVHPGKVAVSPWSSQTYIAEIGREVVARARQPLDVPRLARVENRAKFDPELPNTDEAVSIPGGDREAAWTRRFFAALGRFREGVYVNFLGRDEHPDRVREAYGDSVYHRLVDVKTTYDPGNVFHHNQNIRPRLSDGVSGSDGAVSLDSRVTRHPPLGSRRTS